MSIKRSQWLGALRIRGGDSMTDLANCTVAGHHTLQQRSAHVAFPTSGHWGGQACLQRLDPWLSHFCGILEKKKKEKSPCESW